MVTSSLGSTGIIIQTECSVFLLMKLLMCPLYCHMRTQVNTLSDPTPYVGDTVNPRVRSYDFWQKKLSFRWESLTSPLFSHIWLLLLWRLPALQPGRHRAATSTLVKAQGEGSLWDHDSWSWGWEVDQQTAPMQSRTHQPLPCPRNVPSARLPTPRSPSKNAASSRNWHCLDAISDQTQSRPLYKRFRFWQTGVKNCFSWGCPRETSWVRSLGIKPASLQPGWSASPSGFKWNLDRSQGSCHPKYI